MPHTALLLTAYMLVYKTQKNIATVLPAGQSISSGRVLNKAGESGYS